MPNTSASGGYLRPVDSGPTGIASPTYDASLEDQVQELVVGVTGLPGAMVMPAFQPEPPSIPSIDEDWAGIRITVNRTQDGTPFVRHVDASNVPGDDKGHSQMQDQEEFTVLVSFYGPNAGKYASILKRGLRLDQNWEEARKNGLVLSAIGNAIRLDEQINTRWYRRVDIDFRLNRETVTRYEIQNILSAEGTIDGDAEGIQVTQQWSTENV